jgi:hypothetical protein
MTTHETGHEPETDDIEEDQDVVDDPTEPTEPEPLDQFEEPPELDQPAEPEQLDELDEPPEPEPLDELDQPAEPEPLDELDQPAEPEPLDELDEPAELDVEPVETEVVDVRVPAPEPEPSPISMLEPAGPDTVLDPGTGSYQDRWSAIVAGFIDEPRRTVETASALVTEIWAEIERSIAQQRDTIDQGWQAGDSSTDDLRIAIQQYRTLTTRLVGMTSTSTST